MASMLPHICLSQTTRYGTRSSDTDLLDFRGWLIRDLPGIGRGYISCLLAEPVFRLPDR